MGDYLQCDYIDNKGLLKAATVPLGRLGTNSGRGKSTATAVVRFCDCFFQLGGALAEQQVCFNFSGCALAEQQVCRVPSFLLSLLTRRASQEIARQVDL